MSRERTGGCPPAPPSQGCPPPPLGKEDAKSSTLLGIGGRGARERTTAPGNARSSMSSCLWRWGSGEGERERGERERGREATGSTRAAPAQSPGYIVGGGSTSASPSERRCVSSGLAFSTCSSMAVSQPDATTTPHSNTGQRNTPASPRAATRCGLGMRV